MRTPVHPSTCRPVCLSACLLIFPSACLPSFLSLSLSIYIYIYAKLYHTSLLTYLGIGPQTSQLRRSGALPVGPRMPSRRNRASQAPGVLDEQTRGPLHVELQAEGACASIFCHSSLSSFLAVPQRKIRKGGSGKSSRSSAFKVA